MNLLKWIFLINVTTIPVYAVDLSLHCKASHNSIEVISADVELPAKTRNLRFGEYAQFRFFLSDNSTEKEQKTELQVFDGSQPSRSYAVADLTKSSDVELSIWTQEYLLTVVCKKKSSD